MEPGPLAGIRVLDLGWVWSGPLVATILGEFGAEVIKVEHGKRLDSTRMRGRPLRDGKPVEGPSIELSPMFHQTNHGKRSITLNLKDERACDLLRRLVAISDVVVENLSPGALDRAGLGYDRLKACNPRIVMASMSAAGQFGPLADMRAYAPVMSSFVGLETLIGYPGAGPEGAMNVGLGDPNAATHALAAVLYALDRREVTGEGMYIDLSQIECLAMTMVQPFLEAAFSGRQPAVPGNRRADAAPHGFFPCAGTDRWVSIAVLTDADWSTLAAMAAIDEPRFATLAGRKAHEDDLEAALAGWTRGQDRDTLAARLRRAGIAASPVLGLEEQWEDAHLASRGVRVPVAHPLYGDELLYTAPWRMSETPPRIACSSPILGADNAAVLSGRLGLSEAEMRELRDADVIA
ncbi:MAG: CoA transferase [Alphaproteobacteria bacterium]|nr:CoA transferase [Alphaproteobacteria bacterium]